MLEDIAGERGFQMFSDSGKTYADSFIYTNSVAGIALGLHGYANDATDTIKEFGLQLDVDGYLYHKKLDGTRQKIATVDMISGGASSWNGGNVSNDILLPLGKGVFWDNSYTGIVYRALTYTAPVQKILGIFSEDILTLQAKNELHIASDRIYITNSTNLPVEIDFSGANSFPDNQYLRFQIQNGGGARKLVLVSD